MDVTRLRAAVEAWIGDETDPDAAVGLQDLLDAGAWDELADRFAAPLTFGTAGLRGPVRAGPNGMNRTVVRQAAAGLAAWLTATGAAGRPVVIGYDGRVGSYDFAHDSAAVFAAAGFDAKILPRELPTPVLAFAVRHLGAAAGVMVTASHNPPRDNGYKVYVADGAQIAPPVDAEIEAAIRAVASVRAVPLAETYEVLENDVVDAYVEAVAALAGEGPPPAGGRSVAAGGTPNDLRIVHTAMHGVGTEVLRRVFAAAGFAEPISVLAQAEPDADFPTVAFPNPEEPGALDLAIDTATQASADLIIANDPDADRCAVAVPDGSTWRMLRGDEVGVLLADALLAKGGAYARGTYATTIVSSSMLRAMAADHAVGYAETLTGFKWISRAAPDLVFGYEEALGYAVAPDLVRDKDGISAALLVAELAARLKADGRTLLDRLADLWATYGRYATDQLAVRVTDLAEIGAMMARLRAAPPATLLAREVSYEDLLPATDGVRLSGEGVRVVVRPSGTEPKLKAYLEVIVDAAADPSDDLAGLKAEVASALGV